MTKSCSPDPYPLAPGAVAWLDLGVSIHAKLAPLLLGGALCACGSASGKIEAGGQGAKAQATFDDGPNKWEDNDAQPEGGGGENTGGRAVEGHAWDSEHATATLPGFREFEDGTSRVFIEVSGHVEVKEAREPGVLRYRFDGVRVPARVNQMSLPTLHFSTPVTLVQVQQVGDAAELVINLRQQVEPKVHLKRTDGGTVLSVDFPKYFRDTQLTRPDLTQAGGTSPK